LGVEFFAHLPAAHASRESVLTKMQDALTRANSIVVDVVDLSRSNGFEVEESDLNECLRRAINLTCHHWRSGGVAIEEQLTDPLPAVLIRPVKIDQIFVNLLTNAIHAMPDGGEIKIRTYAGAGGSIVAQRRAANSKHLRAGDQVVVAEIRDYGTGIPDKYLEKVFDPFFTTKPTGKGTDWVSP